MPNPFVHIELHADDVKQAKKFYGGLLDWKLEDMQMGPMTYTTIGVGEGTGGGMTKKQAGQPAQWLPYIQVRDLGATTKKAAKLGAKVLTDSTEVPGMGHYAVIQDPTGATVGLWEPKA